MANFNIIMFIFYLLVINFFIFYKALFLIKLIHNCLQHSLAIIHFCKDEVAPIQCQVDASVRWLLVRDIVTACTTLLDNTFVAKQMENSTCGRWLKTIAFG